MPEHEIEDRADEVAYLLVRVYEIHEIVIAETCGLSGLRDAALLHSAAARPSN
jgi:prophage maintenance system killer protein